MQQERLQDFATAPPPAVGVPDAGDPLPPSAPDLPSLTLPRHACPRRTPSGRPQPRRRAQPAPRGHHDRDRVVAGAFACTALVVAFDLALTERLSLFFDLCFVLVGLTAALVVRRQGLFAVGVLPPLLLAGVVAVLAVGYPAALTASHLAFVSTWLTGLAHHGVALAATHAVVLVIVWARAAQ